MRIVVTWFDGITEVRDVDAESARQYLPIQRIPGRHRPALQPALCVRVGVRGDLPQYVEDSSGPVIVTGGFLQ